MGILDFFLLVLICYDILLTRYYSGQCPEERPEFGSPCPHPDVTCYYGNQTCCGEVMARYQLECVGGRWRGFHIDTVCMIDPPPCPTNTTIPSCACLEVYQPVCGVDGETYSNTCKAGCGGAEVQCQGECPCQE